MRSHSLPFRLAATSMAVAALTSALLVAGVQLLLTRSNQDAVRARLADRATAASATVRETPDGIRTAGRIPSRLGQDSWIFDTHGRLRSGRLSTVPAQVSTDVRALSSSSTPRHVTHDDLVLLAEPVVRDGRRVATVVAAEDFQPYESAQLHSLRLMLVLAAASTVIAGLAAWLAATGSLRRVLAMAETADEWREHDLGRRFDPGPGGDEIAHLGRTLDTMLDRISEALSAERRLSDEIAHELRTPLAVVLAEAELARSTTSEEARTALDAIHEAALRMAAAIDVMLSAARAETGERRACRVGELLASLDLPPSHLDGAVLAAPVDPLLAAVRPLLDNAEHHGAGSPRVEVSRVGHSLVLSVVDDGPGVPAERLEAVFDPGHSTRAGGSGLGLPLARRMARSVGAELTAQPGPGGRFELRIPLLSPVEEETRLPQAARAPESPTR
jgi:two-component system, OmpR family, sensor kinase